MSEFLKPIEDSKFLDCEWLADRYMEILPELGRLVEKFYAERKSRPNANEAKDSQDS